MVVFIHMAIIEIFTFFLFLFLSFHPQSAATCGQSKCSYEGPVVRFPFSWIGYQQASKNCGWPGFSLSCNSNSQTIITLQSSREFIVQNIDYLYQVVTINDGDNCLPKRLLNNDLDLVNSPFYYTNSPLNYTFLNCSFYYKIWSAPLISCLSSETYKVIVVPTSFLSPPDHEPYRRYCVPMSTTLVPSLFDWLDLDLGSQLTWSMPDCRYCEARGLACGANNGSISSPRCFGPSEPALSAVVRYCIAMAAVILGILSIGALAVYIFDKKRARGEHRQPNMELSIITYQQPSVELFGLDRPTIELYPKIQLGERSEFPKQLIDDNTCPICLGEYQPKETLRTIPQCNHYFHANCIDEWLRRNATCPLCRLPPK
ncbi:hypothetical protein DVH24_040078 [Malus domestica]|uniref:RING-type E3 ubiquitin transferase n=1 Tax=Malus domestica TaxID=3750 RepID=A0A498I803_MALDO|nr:hypothetical protein DVH24_040078 [Malus domestica]